MSNNPEELKSGPEARVEAGESSAEQLERQRHTVERRAELSPRDAEQTAERARVEALETAISVEAGGGETKKTAPTRRGPIGKKQRTASYKRTMKQVQSELSPTSRTFSKIIHNKFIEKTSDVVGNTVARPNAILAGAVSAFVLTLVIYVTAKIIGYKLSGFESIAAFIVGWVIGIIYDYLRLLITGKKS
jgi:hypothetical protein